MSLKLYQMVKLTRDFEILSKDTVGQIFTFTSDNTLAGIRIGKELEFTHAIDGFSDNNDGYFVPVKFLVPSSMKRIYKIPVVKKCCKCGNIVRNNEYVEVNGKYLCNNCRSIKSYGLKNDVFHNKPVKSGKTYGFEFECVCNEENRDFVTAQNWGLIPTHDGSLPVNGVEFKTPTYNGLRGVRHVFKTMDKKVSFSNSFCGQHINIGDRNWLNSRNMAIIRNYRTQIFNPLRVYLEEHPKQTKKVIGRGFGQYRSNDLDMVHGSWINLDNNNRIEFRMSKFVNPNQYFNLTIMWTEMIDSIINNVLKTTGNNRVSGAKKAGDELVNIFQKYYRNSISG